MPHVHLESNACGDRQLMQVRTVAENVHQAVQHSCPPGLALLPTRRLLASSALFPPATAASSICPSILVSSHTTQLPEALQLQQRACSIR
jgi:hypothetical protein